MQSAFWPSTLHLHKVEENTHKWTILCWISTFSIFQMLPQIISSIQNFTTITWRISTLTSVYCKPYFPLKSVLCQITGLYKFTYNLLNIIFYQLYGDIIFIQKLHPFEVYHLMSFDSCIHLWGQHCNQDTVSSHHHQKVSYTPF